MFIMCALKTGLPNGSQCVYHEHTEKRVCQRAASAFYHEGTEKWVNRALSVQSPVSRAGCTPEHVAELVKDSCSLWGGSR